MFSKKSRMVWAFAVLIAFAGCSSPQTKDEANEADNLSGETTKQAEIDTLAADAALEQVTPPTGETTEKDLSPEGAQTTPSAEQPAPLPTTPAEEPPPPP